MIELNDFALFLAIISFLLYLILGKNIQLNKRWIFMLFLFSMFIFDVIGIAFAKFRLNNAFYNLMTLIEFNVLFVFYRLIARSNITKKVSFVFSIFYNLIFIGSSIYYGAEVFTIKYNTIAPVFGAALIGVVLLMYLRDILLSEEILNYKNNAVFWITTGLLLYYLGTMPLTAIFNFMKSGSSFKNLYSIQHVLTIVMHFCFLIGLLWSWKKVR